MSEIASFENKVQELKPKINDHPLISIVKPIYD